MKIPFWATILSVLGFMFLCYLGVWQLNRAQWKAGVLQAIDKEYEHDSKHRSLSEFFKDKAFFDQNHGIRRGYLEGKFIHDKSIFLGPRVHNKIAGYHLITPFKIKGQNNFIMVNRGWVPDKGYKPQGQDASHPFQKIMGVLMAYPEDNMFVPQNNPQKEEWYRLDFEQIRKAGNIDNLFDLIVIEERVVNDGFPAPVDIYIRPNNNHMQYAAFWFIMGLVLMVVYMMRFVRMPEKHGPHVDES